jgi:hypothetical protein
MMIEDEVCLSITVSAVGSNPRCPLRSAVGQPAGSLQDCAETKQPRPGYQVAIPERELDSEAFIACYTPDQ